MHIDNIHLEDHHDEIYEHQQILVNTDIHESQGLESWAGDVEKWVGEVEHWAEGIENRAQDSLEQMDDEY